MFNVLCTFVRLLYLQGVKIFFLRNQYRYGGICPMLNCNAYDNHNRKEGGKHFLQPLPMGRDNKDDDIADKASDQNPISH